MILIYLSYLEKPLSIIYTDVYLFQMIEVKYLVEALLGTGVCWFIRPLILLY